MKNLFFIIIVLFTVACSAPLDGKTVEVMKLDLNEHKIPLILNAPSQSKVESGMEPEDVMGLYTIFSKKVKAENFTLEVTCQTLTDMSLEEAKAEVQPEIKTTKGFEKIIEENENGFLYERTEINGDKNYSFNLVFATPDCFMVLEPEPKSDGNTSLEEAQYMFDILTRK